MNAPTEVAAGMRRAADLLAAEKVNMPEVGRIMVEGQIDELRRQADELDPPIRHTKENQSGIKPRPGHITSSTDDAEAAAGMLGEEGQRMTISLPATQMNLLVLLASVGELAAFHAKETEFPTTVGLTIATARSAGELFPEDKGPVLKLLDTLREKFTGLMTNDINRHRSKEGAP